MCATLASHLGANRTMPLLTNDGVLVHGDSPRDVVEEMRRMAAKATTAPITVEDYMQEVAFRAREWDGSEVDATTPESFVETMIAAGLLMRLQ